MQRLDGDLFTMQLHSKIVENLTTELQATRTALLEALDMLDAHELERDRVDELRVVLEDGWAGTPTVCDPPVQLVELRNHNNGPIPLFVLDGDKE